MTLKASVSIPMHATILVREMEMPGPFNALMLIIDLVMLGKIQPSKNFSTMLMILLLLMMNHPGLMS